MAFVNGKADPWGMKVNPSYKKIELPARRVAAARRLRPDDRERVPPAEPGAYFTQLAAPVTTLRKIAEALLDAWPNVQTRCERRLVTDPWKIGRVDRQGVGSRFMLGIVSLGDAARFGLRRGEPRDQGQDLRRPRPTPPSPRRVSSPSRARTATAPFALDHGEACVKAERLPRHDDRLHRGAHREPARRGRGRRSPSSSESPRPRASSRAPATASCPPGFLPDAEDRRHRPALEAGAERRRPRSPSRRARSRPSEDDRRRHWSGQRTPAARGGRQRSSAPGQRDAGRAAATSRRPTGPGNGEDKRRRRARTRAMGQDQRAGALHDRRADRASPSRRPRSSSPVAERLLPFRRARRRWRRVPIAANHRRRRADASAARGSSCQQDDTWSVGVSTTSTMLAPGRRLDGRPDALPRRPRPGPQPGRCSTSSSAASWPPPPRRSVR